MKLIHSSRSLAVTLLLAAVTTMIGCKSGVPEWDSRKYGASLTGTDDGSTNLVDARVILQAGDPIVVTFSDAGGLPETRQVVREDGTITLHYNVTVKAAGKTCGELAQDIRNAYVPKFYNYLTVTVRPEERFFYVGGEVQAGGNKPYTGPITLTRAIDTARGFTDFARKGNIVLTRANGLKFRVNYKKAIKDPRFDPPIFPNDQIVVKHRIW